MIVKVGDCFAYALAIERDEPLLSKGDDFKHTDVRSALSSDRHRVTLQGSRKVRVNSWPRNGEGGGE
jgi:hypothetical protein